MPLTLKLRVLVAERERLNTDLRAVQKQAAEVDAEILRVQAKLDAMTRKLRIKRVK
jgi:predicted  nucleic acid-binding Zn-ribbon protein